MQNRSVWPTLFLTAVLCVGCSSSQQSAPPPAAGATDPNSLAPQTPPEAAPPTAPDGTTEPHASRADGETGAFDPVYFEFNSDELQSNDRDKLHSVAAFLEHNRDAEITISGHCDDRGTPEYNLALGDRRAQAAKGYLKRLGADIERVKVVSYGAERPAATGDGEEAWSRNRRDEFHVAKPSIANR